MLSLRIALPVAAQEAFASRYEVKGLGDFKIARREGRLMIALRGDTWEPLYAASPIVLFVLSSELELRLADGGGRIMAGSFDVPFTRAY